MRLSILLPLLLLAACHAPAAQEPAHIDVANETMIEQSLENSQFAVEDGIENEAVNQEEAEANLS